MKKMKKILCLLLTAAAISTAVTGSASAELIEWEEYDDNMTVYLGGGVTGITLEPGLGEMKDETFKSSNTNVASLHTVTVTSTDRHLFYDDKWEYDWYNSYVLSMRFSGVGKTTLSFVSDADEVKKIRLNVKKYTNPIKELRVPGIKNGKNIYSIFNKDNYASKKISANGPKGSIVVKAAPGWRIKTVRLEDIKNSRYWSHEFYQSRSCKLGLRSSLKAKGYYKLQIVMQNYKNKGKIYLELYIGSY